MTGKHLILETDLNTLRNGGDDAIALFLSTCQRLHEAGLTEGLRDWMKLATSLLPQNDRSEVMVLMLYGYLHMQDQKFERTPRNSLH